MSSTAKCGHVTPTELARLFGVSRKWVYDLVEKGMPRAGRYFDVAECVQWYMAELKSPGSTEEPADVTEARRQLYVEQTEKTRLENGRLRGETIDVEEARALLFSVASILATQHDAVAPRVAALVVGKTDIREIQTLLLDEHRSIRQAIADAIVALPPPGRGDDRATAEADGGSVGGRETHTAA